MSLSHTAIDKSQLSADAQRALSSGPAKMMAARGMAPIANPVDLLTVLYMLSIDPDGALRKAAVDSARGLPERLLSGGLQDPELDPRVIDFFATQLRQNAAMIDLIILNQGAADETIANIAQKASEKQVELISSNEERLLRHPAIIGAVYVNRSARMSTVDRAVELAVRNDVRVPGIAAWDEICRAIMTSGLGGSGEIEEVNDEEKDRMFAVAAGVNADREGLEASEGESISIREMTVPMKIRLATLGNSFDRAVLIRDSKKMVSLAAIKAPGVTDSEAAKYAGNTSLSDDVIGYVATRRDWTKLYTVKLALVQNPKCPIPAAMRLMPHLREKDIRIIARSKGVPSALAAQAKKLLMQRTRGGGKK